MGKYFLTITSDGIPKDESLRICSELNDKLKSLLMDEEENVKFYVNLGKDEDTLILKTNVNYFPIKDDIEIEDVLTKQVDMNWELTSLGFNFKFDCTMHILTKNIIMKIVLK